MVGGIIQSGCVTLKSMALYVNSKGLLRAKLAKVERLLQGQVFDYCQIGLLILQIVRSLLPDKFLIAIDRTNWKFGKKDVNYLVACIVVGKISLPIAWLVLDKKGNSNSLERQELIRQVLKIVPAERIASILADREFVGKDWLTFLQTSNIPFIIRVKENQQINHPNGGKMKLKRYFTDLKRAQFACLSRKFADLNLQVTCLKLPNEKLIVVSSNTIGQDALKIYAQRWSIERCFKSLKGAGFNLEQTHLIHPERLRKLFGVASIALTFCVVAGHIKEKLTRIPIKKHGRPLLSIFTYGFSWLKEFLIDSQKSSLINLSKCLFSAIIPPET